MWQQNNLLQEEKANSNINFIMMCKFNLFYLYFYKVIIISRCLFTNMFAFLLSFLYFYPFFENMNPHLVAVITPQLL